MNVVSTVNVDDCHDDNEAKLRTLFDQALAVMLNEATSRGCIRPVPALLADGKTLDLFKLFRVVRRRGGIYLVSGFWTFVAKELGLECSVSASVKLIYFKYLYELERWLSGCCSGQSLENGELKLEARFRILLSDGYCPRGSYDKHSLSDSNSNGKCMEMDVRRNKVGLSGTKLECRNRHHDDDDEKIYSENKKYHNNENCDSLILDSSTCKKIFISRKRKRDSLSEMLNWVVQIAKCPYGSSVGQIPPSLKWKDHGGDCLWLQAVRARDSLLQRRWNDSNPKENSFQSNQKIQPSMYDDVTPPTDQCSERLRCSERISASAKMHPCACCNSNLSHLGKHLITHRTECYNGDKEQKLVLEKSPSSAMQSPSEDESQRIHPFVGPRFQAKIPEWSDVVSESDSKWLGTRLWPIIGDDDASLDLDIIEKGRPSSCNCQVPGSVECVRFHIAEKRMKLKREIGKVFYHWRFDRMGEEVSLRWTALEESRFKDIVLFNPPSLGKCFWDDTPDNFPTKKREELVSYYFNVFVVRRRCYQNRVTPKDIDSDDDELEFGCLSDLYGVEAVKVSGTNMMPCLENKEFTDFK